MTAIDELRCVAVVFSPLVLLSFSSTPSVALVGVLAAAITVIAAAVSLASAKLSIYALMIGVITLGLIAIGSVSRQSAAAAYIQAVQLLAIGMILSDYRKVRASFWWYLLSVTVAVVLFAINFSIPKVYSLIVWNRTWSTWIFENPNVLGISFAVLTIYAFLWSTVVAGTRLRLVSYPLLAILLFFVAASGSRVALVTLVVFFFAYFLAMTFAGDRRLLWSGAALTLLIVPLITFGYPMTLGAQIRLSPPSQNPPYPILSTPVCVRTAFAPCLDHPVKKKRYKPDSRAGGFLGLKKDASTGREKIWPAVIQMAARSPILGHGLGAFPGAYLAAPYTGKHAHNGFVQAYYQFGVVGLGLYLLLWCVLFSRAIRLPEISARSASVAVLCAACVVDTFDGIFFQANLGIGLTLGILATTEFAQQVRVGNSR
jgi:hypothetical protein